MVYLVDDDTDDLELAREALERSGLKGQISSAKNGEDFMSKLLTSELPKLVVLDLNMPLKDGFEVLTELKHSNRFAAIPVIILTASHNPQDEERCLELGCSLFLRKPSTLQGYNAIASVIRDFHNAFAKN